MKTTPRYQVVTVSVKLSTSGRGLTEADIQKLCRRLEKTAKGRSELRNVSAIC